MANADTTASGLTKPTGVRVFVGLKTADEIAADLAQRVRHLKQAHVRLVEAADIHLTLVPPWQEEFPSRAIETLRTVAAQFGAFHLTYERIRYGPDVRRPRLVWVDCAQSDEIAALRAALLRAYERTDNRPFQPHVTLARIRGNERSIARTFPLDIALGLAQDVATIELFQAPSRGATGYAVLASERLCHRPEPSPPT
jgi:2'-5' RNA ligase